MFFSCLSTIFFCPKFSAVAGYNANYGNPEAGYAGNTYPVNYGMNPVSYAVLSSCSTVFGMQLEFI